MASEQFDSLWKLKSVELAAMEQLEAHGQLIIDDLFKRAKLIYDEGNFQRVGDWFDTFGPIAETKEENKRIIESISEATRPCPVCGENVPVTWKRHLYKTNGELCDTELKPFEERG